MAPVAPKAGAVVSSRWIVPAALGSLLLLVYFPVLRYLVWQWSNDEDMGHGFFVPLVAAYIIWQQRERLREIPIAPCWWGLALMVYSIAQAMVGTMGVELFLSRTAFLFSLIGLVLFTGGRRLALALAFPLFLLFFMIPIPTILYTRITFPLQLIASRAAEVALGLLQVPVLRSGNVLELPGQTLSVVEACSGIRSLLSLGFLSLVYGHFFESRVWARVVLFLAAVPIAITTNAARVTITGLIGQYRPELVEGFLHTAEGWVIFMVALGLLVAFHGLLGRVFGRRPAAL